MRVALDTFSTSLDHLIKLVDDGGLADLHHHQLIDFLQALEQVRNRIPLLDHAAIDEAHRQDLPHQLCQGSMRRVLTSALRTRPRVTAGPAPPGRRTTPRNHHP